MKYLTYSIYIFIIIFVLFIIYGYFYNHKDTIFSQDIIILKHFYNSHEIKKIKDIINNHNLKSKLIT